MLLLLHIIHKHKVNIINKTFKNGGGVLSVRNRKAALTFPSPRDILPPARVNHLNLPFIPSVQILEVFTKDIVQGVHF